MTVFAIVPLYSLDTVARIIFEVLTYRLSSQTVRRATDQLDFSNTVIYRTLFFAIGCILVHFFLYPKLWIGPGEKVPARYAGYPPYGVQPTAQFPGQWGFPGQPSQSLPAKNESSQTHQPDMGVYAPPHAASLTNITTGVENVSTL